MYKLFALEEQHALMSLNCSMEILLDMEGKIPTSWTVKYCNKVSGSYIKRPKQKAHSFRSTRKLLDAA